MIYDINDIIRFSKTIQLQTFNNKGSYGEETNLFNSISFIKYTHVTIQIKASSKKVLMHEIIISN